MGVVRRGPTGLNPSLSLHCVFLFLPSTDGAGEKWGPEGWGLGRLCKPPFLFGAHLQRRWGLLFILNSLLSCHVFSSPHSAPFFLLSCCPRSSSSPFGFLSLRGFSWLFPLSSSSGLGWIVSACFPPLYSEARKLSPLVWKQSGTPV